MLKLRINPIVAKDLKNIKDYIAEDNEEYSIKTIKEIYGKFENLQMSPGMGADLSKRVSFRTDYKYAIWEDYVIIYKVSDEFAERFTEAKLKNRLTVTGILLSADDDCGKSLLPFCDKIYRLGDMSADEIALEVIGKKV